MKRFLDCNSSDFEKMTSKELLVAIGKSEGRIVACETIGMAMPMLGDVTNAEFVATMGADTATIKEIALMCKMTGTDIHHLGDSGYLGIALPENILAYGTAIRGIRHTYHRMAVSIKR